jgi:chromosome segregation ATPase
MLGYLTVILLGALQTVLIIAVNIYYFNLKTKSGLKDGASVTAEIEKGKHLLEKINLTKDSLIPIPQISEKIAILHELSDSVQTEKGRTAITQIELETVENRLRELEEIQKELEASEGEAKEELTLLKEREQELIDKNNQLKKKLEESRSILEMLLSKVKMSKETREALEKIREELNQIETQNQMFLQKIAEGNDQYFKLKRRFDALDIEYAQLYEKFVVNN